MKGNFDLDLRYGEHYENVVREMLGDEASIEVKTERRWVETGNVAFEVRYRGQPSGVATTEARWWFHLLAYPDGELAMAFVFPTRCLLDGLRQLYRTGAGKLVTGGDNDWSQMVLVRVADLWRLGVMT